jgi:TPR repeat protein
MAWNEGFSDQENLKWSMLRAIEWGIWPAFLSQSIVPLLLIVFEWWEVIGVFIILTILWSFVRYRYVNVAMARFGVFFVLLKWITVPAAVIYLFVQHNYISAVVALLWPIFLAPYLGIFIGGTKIDKIQEMFMSQLGYIRKQPPESGANDDTHQGVPQDYAEEIARFRKVAEQGNADAQMMLGYSYAQGRGVPKDYAQAAAWHRKAAEQGNAQAQYNLGDLYDHGRGVPQDYTQAAFWYRKAGEQGNAASRFMLGDLYRQGLGVPQDYAQAAFWYRKAAEQGFAPAQYNLGLLYDKGQSVLQDYAQAALWFSKAAEQGVAEAQCMLGAWYGMGQGVPQDYSEAYFWSDVAAAGKQDASMAETATTNRDLALSLLSPDELARAQERARVWFEAHRAKP